MSRGPEGELRIRWLRARRDDGGHRWIIRNLHRALDARLRGSGCEPLGPDAGVATVGDTVRYPDALVTRARVAGTERPVPGVVAVFEVPSPSSGRTGRIRKRIEHRAVRGICRCVVPEHAGIGVTVHSRAPGETAWTTTALTEGDTLSMPEIGSGGGVEIPVAGFYEGTDGTGEG